MIIIEVLLDYNKIEGNVSLVEQGDLSFVWYFWYLCLLMCLKYLTGVVYLRMYI
jgi:hypothetical protein